MLVERRTTEHRIGGFEDATGCAKLKTQYENPYHTATENDEEYRLEMQKCKELEQELCEMIGGMETENSCVFG